MGTGDMEAASRAEFCLYVLTTPQGLDGHGGLHGVVLLPGLMSLSRSSRWPEVAVRVPCGQATPSGMGPGPDGGFSSVGCWPTVGVNRAGRGGNSSGPHWSHEQQGTQGSRSGSAQELKAAIQQHRHWGQG